MITKSQIQQYQLKRDDNITIKIICMMGHRFNKNTDINLQSIPSEKSIYIQNKSVDSSRKLCQAHAKCFMDPRFSKSQIKSLSTLPSHKQIIFSKASIHEHSSKARKSSRNMTENCTQTNVNRFMKPIVSKIAIKSKRHGQIYTNASSYSKNPIPTSKSQAITEIQQENMQLRSRILDYELKQRQYVSVINSLEAKCVKLDSIIAKKANMQKNQTQFVKLMRQMFFEMFGISGIKAVWEKQKQIIEEWAEQNRGERQGEEVQRMRGRGREDRKNNPEDQEQQKQSSEQNGKTEVRRREEKQKVRH